MDAELLINPEPTRFAGLNAVLGELTARAAGILGEGFVGAYLQGSFAVGDADEESDCDFIVVVRDDDGGDAISPSQEEALRAMHREFPARSEHWAQHLEGSYAPASELRTLGALGARPRPRPWLYIDHGMSEMEWSTHCNTEVVRWSLRECGVTLAGPPPSSLVDEVSADVLRATMRALLPTVIEDIESWISLDISWAQRYAVTTVCRMLHTIDSGRVTSKRAALLWARDALDARWRPLIERALDGRASFWRAPSDAADVAETRAFAAWAVGGVRELPHS